MSGDGDGASADTVNAADSSPHAPPAGLAAPSALCRAIEAALFAAAEPLGIEALAKHLGSLVEDGQPGSPPLDEIRAALCELSADYAPRGVHLVERGTGREARWHFQTAPDLAHLLRREQEEPRRLSRAATECLAIIAYHEPVSRAEIEAIRGVQTARGTLDILLEAGWIRIAGRREVPGRPVIYATAPEFLAHFGLPSRRDLPGIDELKAAGLLDPIDDALEEAMQGIGHETGHETGGESADTRESDL